MATPAVTLNRLAAVAPQHPTTAATTPALLTAAAGVRDRTRPAHLIPVVAGVPHHTLLVPPHLDRRRILLAAAAEVFPARVAHRVLLLRRVPAVGAEAGHSKGEFSLSFARMRYWRSRENDPRTIAPK